MKVIRWIQNVAIIAAMLMALNLVDGIEISRKDMLSSAILIVLAISTILGRALNEERRANP